MQHHVDELLCRLFVDVERGALDGLHGILQHRGDRHGALDQIEHLAEQAGMLAAAVQQGLHDGMRAVDAIPHRALAFLPLPHEAVRRRVGRRVPLASEAVDLGRLHPDVARDPREFIAERGRRRDLRLRDVQVPFGIHAVGQIDLDARQLEMLFLAQMQVQPGAR